MNISGIMFNSGRSLSAAAQILQSLQTLQAVVGSRGLGVGGSIRHGFRRSPHPSVDHFYCSGRHCGFWYQFITKCSRTQTFHFKCHDHCIIFLIFSLPLLQVTHANIVTLLQCIVFVVQTNDNTKQFKSDLHDCSASAACSQLRSIMRADVKVSGHVPITRGHCCRHIVTLQSLREPQALMAPHR